MLVLELARCEDILRRDTIIALGNSGTGKTDVALARDRVELDYAIDKFPAAVAARP